MSEDRKRAAFAAIVDKLAEAVDGSIYNVDNAAEALPILLRVCRDICACEDRDDCYEVQWLGSAISALQQGVAGARDFPRDSLGSVWFEAFFKMGVVLGAASLYTNTHDDQYRSPTTGEISRRDRRAQRRERKDRIETLRFAADLAGGEGTITLEEDVDVAIAALNGSSTEDIERLVSSDAASFLRQQIAYREEIMANPESENKAKEVSERIIQEARRTLSKLDAEAARP